MAENKLIIDLIVDDKQGLAKLKSALGSINAESKKTTESINTDWVKVAGSLASVYAAYRAVSGVVSGAIKEAKEQEDAINRLNFALKSQGTFTEAYSKAIQGLGDQFAQTSKFTDDAVLGVMKTLIQLGNVAPAQLQRTTQAVLDFSAATGKGLDESAMAFVRASQGMARELKVLGFEVRKGESEQEALARAVQLTQDKLGGAASNEMATFSGAVSMVSKSWDELLEKLGMFITTSPVVIQYLADVAHWLQGLPQDLENASVGFDNFTKKLQDSGNAFNNLLAGGVGAGQNIASGVGGFLQNLFYGGNPDEAIAQVADTQATMQETVVEAQRAFEEEQKATKLTEAEEEVLRTVENETRKIEVMREMWQAWNDEKLSAQMIQNQQETEKYQFMLDTMQQANQSFWKVAGTLRDQFSTGISNMLSQAIRGTVSWGDAFKELGLSMVDTLIKFGVQLVVNKALASGLQAAFGAQSMAMASGLAAAWSPAALFVSLATFGANAAGAIAGIGSTATALAAAGAAKMVSGIAGLAEGGTLTTSGSVLVGERGAEILNLPRGASVVPLDRATSGGSGETIINIELNNVRMSSQDDIRELAGQISEFINEERRRA